MDNETKKQIEDIALKVVENYNKTSAFTDRKVTDTPIDAFSVVNKKYVDDVTLDDLADVTVTSVAQGDVLYRGASAWNNLAPGTNGQALTTNGASANPAWQGMTTQGDIEYHNATDRTRLAPGTSGQFLQTLGAGANPAWADAASDFPYGGDASDGTVTISINTTLTRDMFYNNLTINSGIELFPAGYRVFVAGTLTCTGNIFRRGVVGDNGSNGGSGASGGTGGAGGAGGTILAENYLLAGSAGQAGTAGGSGIAGVGGDGVNASAGTSKAKAMVGGAAGVAGGSGGASNQPLAGGTGGSAGGAGSSTGSITNSPRGVLTSMMLFADVETTATTKLNCAAGTGGSSGGGAGGGVSGSVEGGGGGGGAGAGSTGGTVIIFCKTLAGAGSIDVSGGAGGTGGTGGVGDSAGGNTSGGGGGGGGGSGGAGGTLILVYQTKTFSGTITVAGGTAGAAGTGGAAGGAGSSAGNNGTAGNAGTAGVKIEIQV
mgnify:CR=1 FL=1